MEGDCVMNLTRGIRYSVYYVGGISFFLDLYSIWQPCSVSMFRCFECRYLDLFQGLAFGFNEGEVVVTISDCSRVLLV